MGMSVRLVIERFVGGALGRLRLACRGVMRVVRVVMGRGSVLVVRMVSMWMRRKGFVGIVIVVNVLIVGEVLINELLVWRNSTFLVVCNSVWNNIRLNAFGRLRFSCRGVWRIYRICQRTRKKGSLIIKLVMMNWKLIWYMI